MSFRASVFSGKQLLGITGISVLAAAILYVLYALYG